jgi:phosphonate transport system substrate-binding protein
MNDNHTPCRRHRIAPLLVVLPLALAAVAGPATAAPGELLIAFIPQENPEKLTDDVSVITAYLARELGRPVRGFVSQDPTAAVEAMRNGDADVTFMGGLPYVLAHHLVGAQVLLAEVYRGRPTYRGRIFVRRGSGIERIEQLRGRSIAFADPISESGYLFPLDIFTRAGLLEAGDDPKRFFGEVYFAGGYQQAVQALANGHVDAAGSSQFAELLLTPEQLEKITWIAESEPIPSHCVVARQGLDREVAQGLKRALLKLNEPAHRHLLAHVYGPDGYVEATHADYRAVEAMARRYGLLPGVRP